MKNILFCILALMMVSCETITGDLTVLSTLTFEDGTTVNPGTIKANIKAKKRSLTLNLPNEESVKFKIPKDAGLPSRNGDITLSQSEIKQPYDLEGRVNTTTTDSDSRRDYERCTYSQPYTVCQTDSRGRRTCYTQYRNVNGYRNVQYRERTENKYLSVSLLTPGTNVSNAQFEGHDVSRFRVYEYTGQCR
jgi:hypothetical protein